MNEDQLIRRMEQGDARAAEELISYYYPQVLRYCIWHVPIRSLAEDATQETFLKALRYFDQYDHRGLFKAFLYRIAANTCIDMVRKHTSSEESLEDHQDLLHGGANLDAVETRIAIKQMVQELPPHLQEIIFLRFSQNLTLKEISQILNIPMRTAQSQLRTALSLLKQTHQKGDFL